MRRRRTGGKLSTHVKLRENVRTQLEESDSDEESLNPKVKPPWCSIALASFLTLVGVVLLVTGTLRFTGTVDDVVDRRAVPMLILGTICFIPGFYILRIAYYVWKGNYGYSFHDIPS